MNTMKKFIYEFIYRNSYKKRTGILFDKKVSQHFLFNALNTAVSLCRKNPEAASELIIEISTYLQKSLEDKDILIPLEEELEHVFSYINIQKARFSDRLKVVTDIEGDMKCRIPAFILQPVVDNAIRHGVLKRKRGGMVILTIKRVGQFVQIIVKDDGEGMNVEQINRIYKKCSKDCSLYRINCLLKASGCDRLIINSKRGEGTAVMLTIPYDR